MYGWTGQRIKVYLSEGKIVKEPLPEELRLNYLGGRGLNSKTLYDEVKPGIDPLSPDNVFMVGVGPLCGTAAPASSRWTVTAKSAVAVPGGVGDGNGGGDFATELKFAGYDQVIFYGRSPEPVYLWINNDQIELRDAAHLLGKNNVETNKLLWKELGDREVRVLSIGPAGENLVRITKVFSNITRSGGKSGMGAVMGSKNLKAVAVRGTGSVKIARPKEFFQTVKRIYEKLMAIPALQHFMEHGMMSGMTGWNRLRSLPTFNAQKGSFSEAEKLSSEVFHSQFVTKHRGCSACPISCSHYYQVKEGPYAHHGESPEYGTINPYGSKCGISDFPAILLMDRISDELGLDTHTTGNTIAFAMHCWQEGLLTAKDTDNLDLSWGNAEAVLKLLPKIAYREGFGNLLADGSFRASMQIKGSDGLARTVKGLDMGGQYPGPGYSIGLILALAISTKGGDHRRGLGGSAWGTPILARALGSVEAAARLPTEPRSTEGKGVAVALDHDYQAVVNSQDLCAFIATERRLNMEDQAQLISAATGIEMSSDDLMKIGERIENIEKAFNIRERMGRKDDTLPKHFITEKETPWGIEGISEDKFQKMLEDYYKFRGWDREGIPTRQKLEELGLSYIAEQIGATSGTTL